MSSQDSSPDLNLVLSFLEDDDPDIEKHLSKALAPYKGDLSHHLNQLDTPLNKQQLKNLTRLTRPHRRERLSERWQIPTNPLETLYDDWDSFEHLLRLLSDYLHDGITPRPTLHDQLDILAEDIESHHLFVDEELVLQHLFRENPQGSNQIYRGNRRHYSHPSNNDLSHVIQSQKGNALTLGILYLLLCQRLKLNAYPTLHPGPFLIAISGEHGPLLIDCFNNAKRLAPERLHNSYPGVPRNQLASLCEPAPLAAVLFRLLRQICDDLCFQPQGLGYAKDLDLLDQLANSLIPQPQL